MTSVCRRILKGLASFLIVASVAACGVFGEPEVPVESRSAEELFLTAEFDLEEGRPLRAARMFDEVERLYPYSEWAKRAMMMSAFAYYDARYFAESRSAAERYLDFFPADEDAAYAQYLIALSYYDQIVDVTRDQASTFDALQELRATIERYPDSDYAKSAELKFDLALDHLAGKEMEVGRYYLKKGHFSAAINRFRVVVEDFQTTQHTAEALHRLIECYLSLGLFDEAQTAGAILGYNYQGSPWYEDSYKLLTAQGLEAEAKGQGWLTRIYRQVIQGKWL
ncbi:outer membrane protein assembly factor BamD [Algicella marina]|uniref:Outer membrane protein assembly factor BamD n=1 Tax=Algicella marina TaxID=2683284 RepID=A0A6P1SUE8_9RHOB|nr:outer membrane protein assembly factor BamD [Algicella marina]QHQ34058.1 outer membrane protein assembly factor BamD [Algicella marina]